MKNFFNFLLRQYFFFLFIILEVISCILIVQNNNYQRSGFINSTNEITGSLLSAINDISQYLSLKETNKILSEENARLIAESKKFDIKTHDSTHYRRDTGYHHQYEFVSVKVIRNSTNKRNNYLMLNKGSLEGITKDMGVISSTGVIGIVKEVSANFSTVISILHKDLKISCKIKKNGQLGTAVWKGKNYLYGDLIDIPTHVRPVTGDTIITSGYSTSFPEGIMIGTINNYKIEKGDNFYTISIKYSTDFNNISYAYVIKNIMKDEMDKLTNNLPDD